jgi:thiamine biosynthesis lipoprotein
MGSPLRLTLGGPPRLAESAWAAVLDEFAAVDAAMSKFAAMSELTQLNRSAGSGRAIAVGRRLERALAAADRARRVTDGRFDPRVLGDLARIGELAADPDMGLDGPDAGDPGRRWEDDRIFGRCAPGSVAIDRAIDLGGIGKGLALRWAADRVDAIGCADYLLDAGGDLVVRGGSSDGAAWQIGIEDPSGGADPLAVIRPPSGAVVTSSVRKRSWSVDGRAVHHLIDPATGQPAAADLRAVTVAWPDPAWAEVWSKALFVGGRAGIASETRRRGMAAWWVTSNGMLEMTPAARAMTIWVAAEEGLVRTR